MYQYGGHKHTATVDGQTVEFDSDLEERVLHELVGRGFSGRWARPQAGLRADEAFYTPDLELALERGGRTHRAIVEIKPTRAHFDGDSTLTNRMRGIASHYGTTYFLVYTDDNHTWWQMNPETGILGPCLSLEPGRLTMTELRAPLSFTTTGRTGRSYRANPHLVRFGVRATLMITERALTGFLKLITPPPSKPRRRTRQRR